MINGSMAGVGGTQTEFLLIGTWEEFEALHKALAQFVAQRHEAVRFVQLNENERFKFRAIADNHNI